MADYSKHPGLEEILRGTSKQIRIAATKYNAVVKYSGAENLGEAASLFGNAIYFHCVELATYPKEYEQEIYNFISHARRILQGYETFEEVKALAALYATLLNEHMTTKTCEKAADMLKLDGITNLVNIQAQTAYYCARMCLKLFKNQGQPVNPEYARLGLALCDLAIDNVAQAKEPKLDVPTVWLETRLVFMNYTKGRATADSLVPVAVKATNISILDGQVHSDRQADFEAFLNEFRDPSARQGWLRDRCASETGMCLYCLRYEIKGSLCVSRETKRPCIGTIRHGFKCVIPVEENLQNDTYHYRLDYLPYHGPAWECMDLCFEERYNLLTNLPAERGDPGLNTTEQIALGTLYYRRIICLPCAMAASGGHHKKRFGKCLKQQDARSPKKWDSLVACTKCEANRSLNYPACQVIVIHDGCKLNYILMDHHSEANGTQFTNVWLFRTKTAASVDSSPTRTTRSSTTTLSRIGSSRRWVGL